MELPELNFSDQPSLNLDADPPPLNFKNEGGLPELSFSDEKLEQSSILSKAIKPIKRIPKVYQKEVTEGIEQIKQPGLWNKFIGTLRFTGAPATAPVEALIGEPTEEALTIAGVPEPGAKFVRALAEGTAYMISPGKLITGQMTKVPHVAKQLKQAQKIQAQKKGFKVIEFIKDRRANIDKAMLDSEHFIIKNVENALTPLEREALPFLRQNIQDPSVLEKIGRQDLIGVIQNPSKALLKANEQIADYYNESFKFLQEHGSDINYIDDYVTQLWDIPKGRKQEVVNYFVTNNPFTKKRKIPTLEEGIKLGLTPKTTDIAELLRIYDNMKIHTAFNLKFADNVKSMVDDAGQSLIQASAKAPVDWVQINHPALSKVVYKGKKGDKILLKDSPVKVHPEIADEMNIIFGERMSGKFVTAVETVNAFAKKAMLTGSLFHPLALTESALASGIGRKALAMWNPKKIYNALKKKDYDIYKNMPLSKGAIDHGLYFGALSDVQLAKVEKALRALEYKTKGTVVGKGVRLVRKANDIWDSALWDYYHNNLKLAAYEEQVAKELKRLKPTTPEQIKQIKQTVAGFVNDSFGGQQFEFDKILGNPKMQQAMQWVLLAPDWTISTLKQAAAPVTGAMRGDKSLMVTGSKFWAKAAFLNVLIAESINYATTKKITGEGKFTWENDPGHETHIFAGYNDDGTKRYLRTGKQFRESIEWVMKPLEKFGGKLSPVMRETVRQLSGHEPGSGFPTEFADKEGLEELYERGKSIITTPVPFSLKPYLKKGSAKTFLFTLPASKGMSNYKTVKLFKNAIKDKDIQKVKRVYISALENDLDAYQLFKNSKASVKSDMTMDDKIIAKDIFDEMKGLDPTARKDLVDIYKKRKILTRGVLKQFNRLVTKKQRIQQQKKALGL